MPVTGLSEPKASGTPWDANSANGFSPAARSAPRRCAYIPVATAPQRVEIGLHAGDRRPTRRAWRPARRSTISRCSSRCPHRATAGTPKRSTTRVERVDHRGDRGVTDDVEARRARRASVQAREVGGDRVAVEVPVAAAVGGVVVGHGCSHAVCEPSAPSTNRSPASPRAPVASMSDRASAGGGDGLAPVADRPRRRAAWSRSSRQSSRPPMSGPAHSCTATMPAAANASRAAVRASARCCGRQQCPCGAPAPGDGRRRTAVRPVVAGRGVHAGRLRAQRGRREPRSARRRAPGRRAGHRARRRVRPCVGTSRSGQPDSIPAVPPDHAVGMGRDVFGRAASRQCCRTRSRPQVESGQGQAGGGDVDVAVHEGRRDECAVEVDDRRRRETARGRRRRCRARRRRRRAPPSRWRRVRPGCGSARRAAVSSSRNVACGRLDGRVRRYSGWHRGRSTGRPIVHVDDLAVDEVTRRRPVNSPTGSATAGGRPSR